MAKEPIVSKPVPVVAPETRKKFDFNHLNTLAVVSFATALTSIGAVAAIITGHVSLTQLKRSGESGRGLALAGVIIGYLTIAAWLLGGLFLLAIGYYVRDRFGVDFPRPMNGRMGWDD